MSTYNLLATECPAVVVPSGFIDPAEGEPTTLSSLIVGMTALEAVPVWQEWAAAIDALGRFGGGARAVNSGLALGTAASLSLPIGAGQASIDGPVTVPTATTKAVSDGIYDGGNYAGVRIFAYLTQAGTITVVNNSLTAPSANCVFLGSCRTNGGAVVDTDESGVMRLLQGGILYRRTADLGPPTDSPPANVMFLAHTAGGYYLWTGTAYVPILDSQTVLTSGSHSTSGPLEDVITTDGSITVAVVDTGGGVWKLQFSLPASAADHTEQFTVYTTVPRGEVQTFRLNFAARGSFSGNYWVSVAADQAGTIVLVLNSNRNGGALDFQVQVARDAPAGSYGPYSQQALTFTLIGPGWTAGVTPNATPTVTEHAYDYSLEQPGPLTLTDAATIATDAELGSPEGVTLCRVSLASDRILGAPTNPTDGQRLVWEVKNTDGSAHTLTLATGAGGFVFGTSITALTAIGAGKTDEIGAKYDAASDRWRVVYYSKGF